MSSQAVSLKSWAPPTPMCLPVPWIPFTCKCTVRSPLIFRSGTCVLQGADRCRWLYPITIPASHHSLCLKPQQIVLLSLPLIGWSSLRFQCGGKEALGDPPWSDVRFWVCFDFIVVLQWRRRDFWLHSIFIFIFILHFACFVSLTRLWSCILMPRDRNICHLQGCFANGSSTDGSVTIDTYIPKRLIYDLGIIC